MSKLEHKMDTSWRWCEHWPGLGVDGDEVARSDEKDFSTPEFAELAVDTQGPKPVQCRLFPAQGIRQDDGRACV